ncbi:MAG: hypothetical protein ACR2QO_08555 [Acidimicrobiales bacterium]
MSAIGSRRRIAIGIVFVVLLAALASMFSSPAAAETIQVPVGDAIVRGAEGDVIQIGSADIAAELVGRACTVEAVVTNQESAHPGNELIVTSGDTSAAIAGIEDTAGTVTTAGGTLTLGSTITVAVKLGPSGISSIGSSLTVTCAALEPAPPAPPVVETPKYTG